MSIAEALQIDTACAAALDCRYGDSASLDDRVERQSRDWLTARERTEMGRWRNPDRHKCWRRGRLLAKELIVGQLNDLRIGDVEILSPPGGRPKVYCGGATQPWRVSISHTPEGALAAISWRPSMAIGVDLVSNEPLSAAFIDLWYTPAEQAWLVCQPDPLAANRLWAVKESIYKACQSGHRFDPRQIEAIPGACKFVGHPLTDIRVSTWSIDNHIAVVVATAD